MAEEKKPKNIEELLRNINKAATASEEDKEKIKQYEKHIKKTVQSKYTTRYIRPAFEGTKKGDVKGAYNRFDDQMELLYKDGKVDIKDETKLHQAISSYALGYFEHAMPAVLKALPVHLQKAVEKLKRNQALDKDEAKDLYETLAHHFDEAVMAGKVEGVQGLSGLEKAIRQTFEKEEEVTTDMLSNLMSNLSHGHKLGAIEYINSAAQAAYIGTLPPGVYASHVADKLKKVGKKISPSDEARFHRTPVKDISENIHRPYVQKDHDATKAGQYGFYLEEPKEKK